MENDEILVLNPKRRRRRGRRRMSALQRQYFGGGRRRRRTRRNPPVAYAANPRRRYRRSVRYAGRRRMRRNPVGGNIMAALTEVLKGGVVGVVGITANNAVGNTAAKMLNVGAGRNTQLVKAGTAVLLPVIVGMVLPQFKRMAAEGAICALAHEGSKFLDQNVWPTLGDVGRILSSSDSQVATGSGGAATTPPSKIPLVTGVGYLPGERYVGGVGYLPGPASYVSGNGNPFRAYN